MMGCMEMLSDIEVAYNQAWHGTDDPTMMSIWCDYCRRSHYATAKSNDICVTLVVEIREAQRQAGLFTATRAAGR